MKVRTREHSPKIEDLGKLEERDNKTFIKIVSSIFILFYIWVSLSFLLTNNIVLTFWLLCFIYITRYNVFKRFIKREYIHPKLWKKNKLRSLMKDRINIENHNNYYKNTQLENNFLRYILHTKIFIFWILMLPIIWLFLTSIVWYLDSSTWWTIILFWDFILYPLIFSPIIWYFWYLCFREYLKFRKIFSSWEVYVLHLKIQYYYIEDNKIFFY